MTRLTIGSSGDEVKKLQQSLVNAGYSVGSSGIDGQYGRDTAAAVKKYQQDNGLVVDGVAGDQTQGKLYAAPQQSAQQAQPTAEADGDSAYFRALNALTNAQKLTPERTGSYDAELRDLYQQIVGRDKFSYDINEDALYNQYRDAYVQQGKMAMQDTMGQAAALTGGYGSSYAQSAGQQQYDAYLQRLNDVVPELYGQAYQRYRDEGTDLVQNYGLLRDMADTEYSRDVDSYNMLMQQDELDRERKNDAYNRYIQAISSTGYMPTAEELSYAGISDAEAQAWRDYYTRSITPKYSGGGSGNGTPDAPTVDWKDFSGEAKRAWSSILAKYDTGALSSADIDDLENKYYTGKITLAEYNAILNRIGGLD